ncbi:hypothetical protein MWT96_04880 [Prescottella equi]|uniref:Uncharacterized protein n=2 Tax=Rhodococcus hoagii TaxID=43767 RepID=A0A9Q2UNB0_RHOHA|nr:hypothetical protein [Prescottella equi]MBM4487010.1 hypothetical protein [Prescottella equi]MBM4500093.1 hypothetical protein [Prescottella equi]MBM4504254.1 hypothetical protein [Prescottella equi]MBM4505278.1 hypothetical protein [Prescottella equi]MBM4515116.1 hypothetical protein [Prescottella equi]
MTNVDQVADELYALDPSGFVAARTTRVAEAKASKDREAATAIARLKKPTVVGWAVNLLARELPDEVDAVLALGDALQRAQRRLDAETLRGLTEQRQRLVRSLTTRAQKLVREHGRALNESALREVSQTLHAAMADRELADTVRRGRLLGAATYSGFGPSGLEAVEDRPESHPGNREGESEGEGEGGREAERAAERERAQLAAAAARAEAEAAHEALSAAEDEWARIRSDVADGERRLQSVRRELAQLEERAEFLTRAEVAALDALATAHDAAEHADRRVADADAAVAELR